MNLVKPIEVVKGSSLSSVVGSTSRFLTLQIDKSSPSYHNDEHLPISSRTSTDVLSRAISSVSHRRSNTVPSRLRKPDPTTTPTTSNQKATHLSLRYKRTEPIPQSSSQPFSPSLLPVQPRRRIRVIDEPDDNDSPPSSIINHDD